MSSLDTLAPDSPTAEHMLAIGRRARAAQRVLALAKPEAKRAALLAAAQRLRASSGTILDANSVDATAARSDGMSPAFVDRLLLDKTRVEAIGQSLESIAALPDPNGQVLDAWTRPNGMRIERVRVPIGVIGIIFESR